MNRILVPSTDYYYDSDNEEQKPVNNPIHTKPINYPWHYKENTIKLNYLSLFQLHITLRVKNGKLMVGAPKQGKVVIINTYE